MCQCNGETMDHILIHCKEANLLGSLFTGLLGFIGSYRRMIDPMYGWRNQMGKHSLNIWNLVPLCFVWSTWWEHNRCMFEDVESIGDRLIATFTESLFDRFPAGGFTHTDSTPLFLESLSFCTFLFSSFFFVILQSNLCHLYMKQSPINEIILIKKNRIGMKCDVVQTQYKNSIKIPRHVITHLQHS